MRKETDMAASLVRSRAMVTHAIDRHRWNEITDGAVLQEDGTIVKIGTYQELSREHPKVAVVGSGNEVMLPGFVNSHHHIGLTPVQLGSPDMPLEIVVRHPPGDAQRQSLPRYALFGL
jgi:5-methylthioadenosine/S-adenosylhomocysteine deaminase